MVKPVLFDAMNILSLDGGRPDSYVLGALGDDGQVYIAPVTNVYSEQFTEDIKFSAIPLKQKFNIDPKYIKSSKLKLAYITNEIFLFIVMPVGKNEFKLYEIHEVSPHNWEVKSYDIGNMTFCIGRADQRIIIGGIDGLELINIVTGIRRSISSKDIGTVLALETNETTAFYTPLICFAGTSNGLLLASVDGQREDFFINSSDPSNKLIPGGVGKINTVDSGGINRVIMLQENGISRFNMGSKPDGSNDYKWGTPIYTNNLALAGYQYSTDSLYQDMVDMRALNTAISDGEKYKNGLGFYLIDANASAGYYEVDTDDINYPGVGHDTYPKNNYFNIVGTIKPIVRYVKYCNRIFVLSPDQQLSVGINIEFVESSGAHKWHKIDL